MDFEVNSEKQPCKDILNFGRSDKPFRKIQAEILEWFQENYDKHDVFVIEGPTAVGKSLIVTTIANWLAHRSERSSVITPTKILQDQYLKDFEEIPVLKGQINYQCIIGKSCRETKQKLGKCCSGNDGELICPYLVARREAEVSTTALFNFSSYHANKMYKDTLIVDECHNVISFLFDFYHVKLWKCEVGYPDDMELSGAAIKNLIGQAVQTLSMELARLEDQNGSDSIKESIEKEIERYGYIRDTIDLFKNDLLITRDTDKYWGQMREFRKTDQEYIYVKPLRVDKIGQDILWPSVVKKMILLSATVSERDVETLGLDNKKVAYYKAESPIPPENRPFLIWPVASMAWRNRSTSIPKIIQAIERLANHHKDQKGVIHCTYDMALKIQDAIGSNPRFWFHDKKNKSEQYDKFRAAKGNQIFVASGMGEGIDLAFDAGHWQVITQLMRPNIGDQVNNWMCKNKPDAYNWEAVRAIIQQGGRICRDPKDYGITYMLDSEFLPFFKRTKVMWPKWFVDSMQVIDW